MLRTSPTRTDLVGPSWPEDRGGHAWPKDREVVTADGARIRYTVRGNPDGPWLVFAAGFMCPDNFWVGLAPLLFDRYRCLFLNYRGVGASSDPRPAGWRGRNVRPGDYTIEKFAGDVLACAEDAGATELTVVGHSMGCEVALETWRQAPARVASIVLVTGTHTSPLHTFYGSKLGARLFPIAYLGLPLLPRPVAKRIPKLLRLPLPLVMHVARFIRALGPHTPPADVEPYLQHFGEVDPAVTVAIARGMHDFDSGPWLHTVDVPTLIVVADHDTFSPPEVGEVVLQHVRRSELVEVVDGSHAALIEFPGAIHDAVSDFLHRELGHDRGPSHGAPDRLRGPRTHSH